jgi:hypothetical protein
VPSSSEAEVAEKVESQTETSDEGDVATQSKEEVQQFQDDVAVIQMGENENVPDVEEHHAAAVPEPSKLRRDQEVRNSSSEEIEGPEQSIQTADDEELIVPITVPRKEDAEDDKEKGQTLPEAEKEVTAGKSERRRRRSKSSSEEQNVAEETATKTKRTRQGRTRTMASQRPGEKFTL